MKQENHSPFSMRALQGSGAATLVTALSAMTLCPGYHAQEANSAPAQGSSTNAPAALPDVVVTGSQDSYKTESTALPKLTQPLRDTPQSITVVPRQLMEDQNATTLRDALRNVAGISIAAGEGGAQGDNLTLRGFSARNDIFLDGMRDYGSYYRDPFNYEAIDVLMGPESVMFGRGSTGGVVNQESKTPGAKQFVDGSVTLGTDLTRRATLDYNQPITNFVQGAAFRLNLMGNDSQIADRDVGESRRYGIAPSLAFGLGTNTRLTLSYLHQSEDDIPDYGLPWFLNRPADLPRHYYYGFKDDYLKTDVNVGTIRLEHDFNDWLTVRNQGRYANYDRDFRITEPQIKTVAPLDANTAITRNEIGGNSAETYLWDQLDFTAKFNTGFVEHTMVFGGEGGRETSDPTRYTFNGVPNTTAYNPAENQNFSATSIVTRTSVDTTATSFGFYAMDSMKLGRYFELSGGGRFDYFSADFNSAATPLTPVATSFTQTITKPSWRGSLVYKPVRHGSVYFSYGTSWNPSAESLSLTAGTANTPPEENQTFELGTKWDVFHERLSLRAAVFRTEKTNARETDPANAANVVNAGEQRVDGFELALSGHITDKWQAMATYDYLASEVISSRFFPAAIGRQLANVPENTLSLWTTYNLPWNLQIGGGFNFVDSRAASSTAPFDPTTGLLKEAPGYWTLNAMVKYTVSKHLSLQANIYNLTDNYYYDQLHPAHVIPGGGVSGLFTARFQY